MPDIAPVRPQPFAIDAHGLLTDLCIGHAVVGREVVQGPHPELIFLATCHWPGQLPQRVVRTDQDLDLDVGSTLTPSAENVIMPANMWPSGVMKVNDSSSA